MHRDKSVPFVVLLSMAVALNGCASTKPVADDAVGASPDNIDAVEVRPDGSTADKSDSYSEGADAASRAASESPITPAAIRDVRSARVMPSPVKGS